MTATRTKSGREPSATARNPTRSTICCCRQAFLPAPPAQEFSAKACGEEPKARCSPTSTPSPKKARRPLTTPPCLSTSTWREGDPMANLGNAWHIPKNPEPRGRGAMRDPVGELVPGMDITIVTGNQFQGDGNPGDQLQTGSSLFFKRAADTDWTELPMKFVREAGNNKYYAATIAATTTSNFGIGKSLQYYTRIPYGDHDTTFLHTRGDGS